MKMRIRLARDGYSCIGAVCCLTDLPFEDKSFDVVVDVVSSVHNVMPDVRKIFSEAARVLKAGGEIFSVMPTNRCSRRPFQGLGQVSFMERSEIEQMLECNFDNVQILSSSYELSPDCLVDNWIVTGVRRG